MRRVMVRAATVLLTILVAAPAAGAMAATAVPAAYGKACQNQSKTKAAGEKQTPFAKCVTAMTRLAKAQSRSPASACATLPRKPAAGSKTSPRSRCVKAGTALIRHGNGIDRAFVDAMIPHHLAGIEMAKVAQSAGQTGFVRGLASSIITAQTLEVAKLRKMSAKLKAAGMKAVSLGLTRAEMGTDRDASDLVGASPFDRVFTELMIAHHQAAMTITKVVLEKGVDKELRDLTGEIVSAQSQEIRIMQQFLTLGPGSGGPPVNDGPH
jgi:uncharacterized protein (DUF305 family)